MSQSHLFCAECGDPARWRCRVDGAILCAPHTTDHLTEFFDHTLIDLDDPAALHQVMAELAKARLMNREPSNDITTYTFPIMPPGSQMFALDAFRFISDIDTPATAPPDQENAPLDTMLRHITTDADRARLDDFVHKNITGKAWGLTTPPRGHVARQISEYERHAAMHDDSLDATRGLVSHAEHDPITVTFLQGSPLNLAKAFDTTMVHVIESAQKKYLCGRFGALNWNPADVLHTPTQNLTTMCQRCVLAIMQRYPLFTRWQDTAGKEVMFIDDAWQTVDSLRQRDDHRA